MYSKVDVNCLWAMVANTWTFQIYVGPKQENNSSHSTLFCLNLRQAHSSHFAGRDSSPYRKLSICRPNDQLEPTRYLAASGLDVSHEVVPC